MSGLNIDITADTRQFQAEADNVPAELQKITDQLTKVTTGGDKAGTSLESSMRSAQKTTAQTESVFNDYTNTVVRGTQKQTEAFGLSNREINSIQKESLRTSARSLALQVEQSAQTFDGTVNGAVSAIQSVGVGVAALGTGPIAGVAVAGVTAFGLIQGAIQSAQADAKAMQANVQTLITDMQKAGSEGSVSFGYIVDKLKEFEAGTAAGGLNLETIKKQAKDAGISFKDYAQALAGNTDQLDKQISSAKKQSAALHEVEESYTRAATQGGHNPFAERAAAAATAEDTIVGNLQKERDAVDQAAQAQRDAAAAGLPDYERKLNLIGQVDAAYSTSAGDVKSFIDAESGVFDTAKYITAMEQRAKALDDYKANLATAALSGPAKDFLESQGQEAAATLLQGYVNASPAQKAELQNIWTTAGEASANSFTDSFANGIKGATSPVITPQVDLGPATRALKQLTDGRYQVTVDGKLSGKLIQ